MPSRFRRLAIVNRGEAAMRLIHAARELSCGGDRLVTIAFYSEPDRGAMFVREADEAFEIGPATFTDAADGRRKSSYLDLGRLERALVATRAEAAWPGWGFVAEQADFVDLCDRLGVVFVGPPGAVMRKLGDKISSKLLAEQAEVPVTPWSGGPLDTLEAAQAAADRLGYPLMLKATAGGGGRGIRKIADASELPEAFERARSEAFRAFGDPTVYLERRVEGARHLEVQIVGDSAGTIWALGVRDCTLQRRHQKVFEEAPSPILSPDEEAALRDAAVRLGRAAGYLNAGTVEFLFDEKLRRAYFMEVNTRLQVEHPVTEVTTGTDLVKLQLHIACGGLLVGDPPPTRGHAIEVRLNAEDPDRAFAPAPGTVTLFRTPSGPGLRVDSGVEEGDEIPPDFDSMIAKIIVSGRDRAEALARLDRALSRTAVVVAGGSSNKGFLQDLARRPEVASGAYDISWIDRLVDSGGHRVREGAEIALLKAAVDAYEAESAVERARFYAAAARGRPEVGGEIGVALELTYHGRSYPVRVFRLGSRRYQVEVEGSGEGRIELFVDPLGRHEQRLTCGGRRFRVFAVPQGLDALIEVEGTPHRVSRDTGGAVRAPAPAVVVSLAVAEGDEVASGQRLAVVEAMKMETSLFAPFAGRVRKVLVRENVQVATGDPLLVLEPASTAAEEGDGVRLDFTDLLGATTSVRAGRGRLDDLQPLMLGYDVDPADLARVADDAGDGASAAEAEAVRRREDGILETFVDLASLFRRQPADESQEESSRRSAEEYLFTYLRDLDARGEGLPAHFLDKLRRALAHYGVEGLERSPALEESLFRIAKSQRRMAQQVAPVLGILERRLRDVGRVRLDPDGQERLRALLDRIIAETQGRQPPVHDLAREVHYRCFDGPLLEQARARAYAEAHEHLAQLAGELPPDEREERLTALVDCPQSLLGRMSQGFPQAGPVLRRAMLEVAVRRHYRIRRHAPLVPRTVGGLDFATSSYPHDAGKARVHVLATLTGFEDLAGAGGALAALVAEVPAGEEAVAELYVWRLGGLADTDATASELAALLAAHYPAGLRRVVFSLTSPGSTHPAQYFTFRPGEPVAQGAGSYVEEKVYRGLHPMMAKRLQLWRFKNFALTRLPSAEDVFFFHGVAHENRRDERLFAVAEVRDLTPVVDDAGRVVQLPELERVFMEALAGIRRFQSRRSAERRLHWNRVLLYIWPPMSLHPDELNQLAQRLAPFAEGLGLEKVVVRIRIPDARSGDLKDWTLEITNPDNRGLALRYRKASELPLAPLDEYSRKVVALRQRGLVYPYEIVKMLAPPREEANAERPAGDFVEFDFDEHGRLVPVDRPYGRNVANVVVGVIRNFTAKIPEGMSRVILLGDPSRNMGSLAEPECARIEAALDLAERARVPLEWFAVSAGAKIAMDSGVENMDWIARVLRRLVTFTQGGGEVNLVVPGINVGAQPYWNAEATMLMHTRGILVMTPEGAMVLTGKQALDYSGGVSAEDNQGIGGYERIMGPNGQAQYFARDLGEACRILLAHYDHGYVVPGERYPRPAATRDPRDRDVTDFPHGSGFQTVGEVFSDEKNPGRKKPFEIRRVMRAVSDQDHGPQERWFGMADAEIGVVWDAHLGGHAVTLLGFESKPLARLGFVPAYGPNLWTSGTLFPLSSKKIARAINAASGVRPLVVLANLSGFDGSPESMRLWQLEFGAEIGRAVVNFRGPIVFCVVSRYHGGAFVVFSNALNDNMEVAALEGSFASVIGGAPAAAVVFAREVDKRTDEDPRVTEVERRVAAGDDAPGTHALLAEVRATVRSEKLGEVAEEFDHVHSIQRAQAVGAVHVILPPERLRPYLIEAVERGMAKDLEGWQPPEFAPLPAAEGGRKRREEAG